MKPVAIIAIACVGAICANAQPIKDTLPLNLPDSIKATAMMVTVQVPAAAEMRQQVAGIGANGVSLALYTGKANHQVRLSFAKGLHIPAKGLDVTATQEALDWSFQPEGSGLYQLLLVAAGDSAENFMLYSGYLHFPSTRQWKLIGTCRVPHQWTTLKDLYRLEAMPRQQATGLKLGPVWCQRSNGSWMPLSPTDAPPPVLPPFSNIDSVQQFAQDSARVAHDMALGLTNVRYLKEGVFYEMLQTGSGPTVAITDTVSVFYKGYLYGDGKVFDQTKEKPARFPLARLIKGWQLGLPLCRVGGKIKLVILSGQAYAIRTRAAKIPPNSILVFEVEVIGVNR